MNDGVPIRLVFADRGAFHEVLVQLPTELLDRHERLIDALREDPDITGTVYVDYRRLVAAYRVEEE
jgi:hypothetical protein